MDQFLHHLRVRNLWLSLPIAATEVATLFNLFTYFGYHEPRVAAMLLALSFSILLMATAFLVARDIGSVIRTLLIAGGLVLFIAQAAANMSESWLLAVDDGALPAASLSQFWGVTADGWMHFSSFVYGGVINFVAATYWVALSLFFRKEQQEKAASTARLVRLDQDDRRARGAS